MADFSITGEVRINSDSAQQSVSKWTVAAGQLIADFAKSAAGQLRELGQMALNGGAALEQSIGGVETLFKESASIVKANADNAYRTTGLSANAYMEQTTSFAAALLSSLGNDTAAAAQVADMAMVDMADNANKMGTDIQSIQNAYQGFAKQNYTMLDNLKLGYGGTKEEMQRLLADAEAISGVHYDLSNLADVYNAIHVIQTQLDITGTTAEEAATTISGSASAMQAAFQNVLANLTLGEDLRPSLAALVDTTQTYLTDNLLPAVSNIVCGIPEIVESLLPEILSKGSALVVSLLDGLAQNQDELFAQGLRLTEMLLNGITDNLPALITAAAGLIAQFAAALITHLPEILDCGAQLLAALAQGIVRGIENLGEAALACIAKLLGLWDGSMDDWGHIGENLVAGLLNGITGAWTGLVKSVQNKVSGLVDTVKDVLGIHSPSKVFEEIGAFICAGLSQGIEKGIPYVENLMANFAQQTVSNFAGQLDSEWESINNALQTNTLGSIQAVASAIQNGDVAQLGQWAAAIFWHACTEEQRTQIQTLAMEALNRLTSSLQGVGTNLVNLAVSLVSRFVPAAGAAATAQAALNTVMDANPILLVVSLLGLLGGALVTFGNSNNKVASRFAGVWRAVKNVISIIFEGILRAVGAAIEVVVAAINAIIWAHNKLPFVSDWDYVENPFWKKADELAAQRKENDRQDEEALKQYDSTASKTDTKKVIASNTDIHKDTRADGTVVTTKVLTETLQDSAGKITQQVTKTITESGTRMVDGIERAYKKVTTFVDGVQTKVEQTLEDANKSNPSTPTPNPTPTPAPDDSAIKDNTAAILEANKKLAEMVKNANALVLTDNRVIGARVAASGTAQVAAAANNYRREGDTNITQNFYNGHDTAAEQQREARWEADRAKATKR